MQHKVITGESGPVHYWVKGQGENCIVFTHGATMDHGLFQYQIDHFSPKYRVIVWDVPMHGMSRPYDDFSLQNAANEIVGILNAEEIEKTHLVGQSMGGYISQYLARDHTKRVKSCVAVGSSPLQPSYYTNLDNWLLSITPPILRWYPYGYLIKTIAAQIALSTQSQEYALKTLKQYSKSEIAEIMEKVYRGVKEYRQESVLQIPVLIVYGDCDRTGKVQTYCKQWAERENRPLRSISNAAHNANMDNPKEFNRVLDEFLTPID